jgi:hypothetical protein
LGLTDELDILHRKMRDVYRKTYARKIALGLDKPEHEPEDEGSYDRHDYDDSVYHNPYREGLSYLDAYFDYDEVWAHKANRILEQLPADGTTHMLRHAVIDFSRKMGLLGTKYLARVYLEADALGTKGGRCNDRKYPKRCATKGRGRGLKDAQGQNARLHKRVDRVSRSIARACPKNTIQMQFDCWEI